MTTPLFASALGFYWHLPILVLFISLVYSATRHEHWEHILPDAARWILRMLSFLCGIGCCYSWSRSLSEPRPIMSLDPLPPPGADPPASPIEFRWQGFFQRTTQPFFLLDRQRRLRFVNAAWEQLTGVFAVEAHGLVCSRRAADAPEHLARISAALSPPRDVLDGRPAHARRLVTGSVGAARWWDIDFFPLQGERGVLGILGTIRPAPSTSTPAAPLPERLIGLREQVWQRAHCGLLESQIPAMRTALAQVRLASQTRGPVMLVGEAGTGRQTIARIIHAQGSRREQGFAGVDGERLPPRLLNEVLFGSAGLLRQHGLGTLWLREPARLPRDLQQRLADWLHTRHESTEPEASYPRLIAGSTAEAAAEVASGRLLDELAQSLSTLVIRLPPLRERTADLPVLVGRLLERATALVGSTAPGLSPDTWDVFRAYRWPGNLTELFETLVSATAHAAGRIIEATDLPATMRRLVQLAATAGPTPERSLPLDTLLEEVERRLIVNALRQARGNKTRAAELLSIWRPRLIRRMEALGIRDE